MKNGCHDRPPFRRTVEVQHGFWYDGQQRRVPKLVQIPFRMNPECQYTLSQLGQADEKCAGCKWKKPA